MSTVNFYYALLRFNSDVPFATLPVPGTKISDEGTISGLKGALSMWNGQVPRHCNAIVCVRSAHAWSVVPDDEKWVVWQRENPEIPENGVSNENA